MSFTPQTSTAALVASTVTTVDIPANVDTLEVGSIDGSAAIWYTLDGSTPTVGGAACYLLPAVIGSRLHNLAASTEADVKVKLISAGTPTYFTTAEIH